MSALTAQQTELAAVCRERLDAGHGLITMLAELRAISATQHDPPLTDDQVLKVISHVTRERGDSEAVKAALRAATEQPIPLTDLGNAERLVLAHGPELRFVPALGWHVWGRTPLQARHGRRRHAADGGNRAGDL